MKEKPSQFNGVPIPYDASIAELRDMLDASPPQCWAAFIALGFHPGPESLGLLVEQLSSPDAHVRRAALSAIGTHSQGGQLEQTILMCFQDTSGVVVREACRTTASLGLDSAHDAVFSLLDAPDESTRLVAVSALGSLWHAIDSQKVQTVFLRDRADSVRKEAAWVLRNHASPDNCRSLFHLWYSDTVPRHRKWACELVAEFGLSDIRHEVENLLDDPDGHVRHAARIARDKLISTRTASTVPSESALSDEQ